jgi:hypothetical protein
MAFNIKGLFIQMPEEEDKKLSTPTTTPVTVPSSTYYPVGGVKPGIATPAVDPTISASLSKAMEDANLPSYDYFEFAQAIEQQASIIPDEATRFKSVGMMAAQMGATPDKLIEAAQKYLGVLKSKEDEFVKAMKENIEAVSQAEKEASGIDTRISELMAEVTKLQSEKQSKIDGVGQSRAKIESVKANFYATLQVFTGKITADIDKIKTYLIKK